MLRKIEIRSNDVSQVNCFKEKYSLQMCFIKRHPEVSVRATEKFGRARTSVSAEDVAPFYDKLLETLTSNKYGYNFFVFPNRIFNCDETAMEFDAISKFVCAEKGQKFVPGHCCGMHEKVSVLSLVEVLYPTYLFINLYLVKSQNMLLMELRNQQCSKAKNLGRCQKTYT